MQVGVGVRLRLGSWSMSNNFEFFEEELNTGAGWGRGWTLIPLALWPARPPGLGA